MALAGSHAPGATPLDAEQLEGLKLPISTLEELNAAEQDNILAGQDWAQRSRTFAFPYMLSDDGMRKLHRRMFGAVYTWAGTYRQRETAVGVEPMQIPVALRVHCDDARHWLEQAVYGPIELAIRLHHGIVRIHPFRNGNGRQSRLAADLLLMKHFGIARLPWGGGDIRDMGDLRVRYRNALIAADEGQFDLLIEFATQG